MCYGVFFVRGGGGGGGGGGGYSNGYDDYPSRKFGEQAGGRDYATSYSAGMIIQGLEVVV